MENVSLVDGHIDNGISDEDIIKALECCSYATSNKDCEKCPYYPDEECVKKQFTDILNLINRQKAEIEKKTTQCERLEIYMDELVNQKLNQSKAEAIKEFAERLKIFVIPQKADGYTREIVLKSNIDNLVKEMIGEQNE